MILLILFSSIIWAQSTDSYVERLNRLQLRSSETQAKLQSLAVPTPRNHLLPIITHSEREETPMIQVHESLSRTALPPGKLLFGKLLNRLVVGGDESPVLIEFDEAQGFVSRLRSVGTARQSGTQGRISIELKKILLRSGRSLAVSGVGLDSAGAFGLEAAVITQKTWAMMGSIAGSFISGAASAQQTQIPTAYGFSQAQPSARNSILQGVAQTAADQSKHFLEAATREKPILIVETGTEITILVQDEATR